MKTPLTTARAFTFGFVLVVVAAACTPEQHSLWAGLTAHRAAIDNIARGHRAPSEAQLARLRACESKGSYSAVSRSGRYRGAYQFSRRTWNNVAKMVLPSYHGVDPAAAPAHVQDAMARALWSQTGWRSWPVCGRRA
jgi:hypothetical protein